MTTLTEKFQAFYKQTLFDREMLLSDRSDALANGVKTARYIYTVKDYDIFLERLRVCVYDEMTDERFQKLYVSLIEPIQHNSFGAYTRLLNSLVKAMNFDKVPPKYIIKALFDNGHQYVLYRTYGRLGSKPKIKILNRSKFKAYSDLECYFSKYAFCRVQIIDPKTGFVIKDLPDDC